MWIVLQTGLALPWPDVHTAWLGCAGLIYRQLAYPDVQSGLRHTKPRKANKALFKYQIFTIYTAHAHAHSFVVADSLPHLGTSHGDQHRTEIITLPRVWRKLNFATDKYEYIPYVKLGSNTKIFVFWFCRIWIQKPFEYSINIEYSIISQIDNSKRYHLTF